MYQPSRYLEPKEPPLDEPDHHDWDEPEPEYDRPQDVPHD